MVCLTGAEQACDCHSTVARLLEIIQALMFINRFKCAKSMPEQALFLFFCKNRSWLVRIIKTSPRNHGTRYQWLLPGPYMTSVEASVILLVGLYIGVIC